MKIRSKFNQEKILTFLSTFSKAKKQTENSSFYNKFNFVIGKPLGKKLRVFLHKQNPDF